MIEIFILIFFYFVGLAASIHVVKDVVFVKWVRITLHLLSWIGIFGLLFYLMFVVAYEEFIKDFKDENPRNN